MNPTFKLIEPVSLTDYIPIIKDVSFGNLDDNSQAMNSYAQYVGLLEPRRKISKFIKKVDGPDIWQQRIAYFEDDYPLEPVGITGWYIWPPFNLNRIWLGWFGIRNQYKGKGYGKLLLNQTMNVIKNEYTEMKELFVFTDDADGFYQKCGFEKLGRIEDLIDQNYSGIDKNTGFNLNEIVLKKKIK